jgi:hypothetical protein
MESEKYLLWSGRLNGWLSNAGTYVSGAADAREFDHGEALEYCRRHFNSGTIAYGLLPVALSDVKQIGTI